MNDTVLYLRAGIYRLNGGRKAGQVIRAGNKDILYAAVLEPIEHHCPEFRTFVFADPHAKDVLLAAQINTDCDIDSFLDDLAFTSHTVSRGRCCHSFATGSILSVMRLIVVSETSMP